MKHNQSFLLTAHYAIIQSIYWASFGAIIGFPMVFLLEKGFSFIQIGIILSSVNLFSAIIQPAYPKLLVLFPKLTIKFLLIILYILSILISILILYIPETFVVYWIIFVSLSMTQIASTSLLNSLAMDYANRGIGLNYGIGRGVSSAAYALVAFVLGKLINKNGIDFLPGTNIFFLLLLIIFILLLRSPNSIITAAENVSSKTSTTEEIIPSTNVIRFLHQEKLYAVFLFASLMIFIGNCLMGSSFAPNLVGQFGGDTSDAGALISLISVFETIPMLLFFILIKKTSIHSLMILSSIGYIGRAIGSYFSKSIPQLMATQIFQLSGYGLYSVASVYYTNNVLQAADHVLAQGLLFSVIAFGNMFANLISGPLLEYYGVHGMMVFCLITTILGSLLMVAAVALDMKKKSVNRSIL